MIKQQTDPIGHQVRQGVSDLLRRPGSKPDMQARYAERAKENGSGLDPCVTTACLGWSEAKMTGKSGTPKVLPSLSLLQSVAPLLQRMRVDPE